jgi:glycosyltransferase involved in cell wall biosynthesis
MNGTSHGPARVLHVVRRMDYGGVEALLMNIYRRVDRSRLQFDFAVHSEKPGCYDPEIRSMGGKILYHSDPSEVGFWSYGKQLIRTLRSLGPFSAIHSHVHYFSGFVLLIAEMADVPIRLAHSHTTRDGHLSRPLRRVYRKFMRGLILRHATDLLAVSEATCRALYGPRLRQDDRVRMIPPAIDLSAFNCLSGDRTEVRRRLGLPIERRLIGHVGTFRPVKNHSFLLRMFAILLERAPDATLVLVGDGPLRPQIEAQAKQLGLRSKLHILGSRSDVPRIMASLDVLLLPSIFEGLSTVLLEAQAVGLPCLVSNGIPPEADAELGLIRFLDLNDGLDTWTAETLKLTSTPRPPWSIRRDALQHRGYDIRHTVSLITELYDAPSR